MITADSPLIGKPSGTLAQAIAWAGQENAEYIRELWRLCELVGLDAGILFAQWAVETHDGTSDVWRDRLNPAGIGWTGDPVQNAASQIWANQTDAARGHVAHMIAYVFRLRWTVQIMTTLRNLPSYDERWDHAIGQPWAGTIRTIRDLTGRWATDPKYHTKIVNRHRAIFGVKENAADDTSDGASQGDVSNVSITAEPCPIETYVAWSGPNRPGLAMPSPSKIVIHEVGNQSPGADEDMHRRFVLGGGGVNEVSFHFVVGPTKIVQLLYLDENAWHASDGYFGDGNRDGWGIEHIQIGDFNKTLAHGAWLCSELARNPRRFAIKNPAAFVQDINPENVDEAMVQHNWEAPDKKECPEFIRERNLWPSYVEAVRVAVRKPSESDTTPKPAPIWWEPGKDVGIVTRESDKYKANAMLVQTYATTKRGVPVYDQIGGKKIAEVAAGEPAIIGGTTRARDAKATGWYFVKVDGGYGRARASSFLDKLPLP